MTERSSLKDPPIYTYQVSTPSGLHHLELRRSFCLSRRLRIIVTSIFLIANDHRIQTLVLRRHEIIVAEPQPLRLQKLV